MTRRSFAVREIAEILDHWPHERPVTAIALRHFPSLSVEQTASAQR
jgi:hypothetical protein